MNAIQSCERKENISYNLITNLMWGKDKNDNDVLGCKYDSLLFLDAFVII